MCLIALAFSTLLSSQGTDAHLQQPPGRLQGNYSNLPDAFPPVKPDPQEFLETSGRSARPPKPYPIPNGAVARYSENRICPGGPAETDLPKAFDPGSGPHLEGRFRLPGAVVPTLHASSCGSDAVGHAEGYNFSARSDIPVQRIDPYQKRRAGPAAGVRRPGRRQRRQIACPGAG